MRARAFVFAVLLVILASPATAGAYVFWTAGGGMIGRADNDGSNVNQSLISQNVYTGAEYAPIAVDSTHLFYTTVHEDQMGTQSVARTSLDGTETTSLPEGFLRNGNGISAVDAAHVYWFDANGIGRANLDGTGREPEFLYPIGGIGGIAVYNGFVYWTDYDGGFGEYIGRANLTTKVIDDEFVALDKDGGGPNYEERGPRGIAVDADGIYFTMAGGGHFESKIGHAGLAGGKAVLDAIPGIHALPGGLAIEGSDLYWVNFDGTRGWIARAELGGAVSTVDTHFIDGAGTYLAVNAASSPPAPPPPPPPVTPGPPAPSPPAARTPPKSAPTNAFKVAKVKLDTSAGSAKLTLDLPGPGNLALAGHGVKTIKKTIRGAGDSTLVVMPTATTRAALRKLGKKMIKAAITFTPSGGPASSHTVNLTLRLG